MVEKTTTGEEVPTTGPGLIERMCKHIQELRTLVAEYETLPEQDQTYTRSQIYRHTGGFGKLVVGSFDEFTALEEKIKK